MQLDVSVSLLLLGLMVLFYLLAPCIIAALCRVPHSDRWCAAVACACMGGGFVPSLLFRYAFGFGGVIATALVCGILAYLILKFRCRGLRTQQAPAPVPRFCGRCGAPLAPGGGMCTACGYVPQAASAAHSAIGHCPHCGTAHPSFAAVCPGCGTRLQPSVNAHNGADGAAAHGNHTRPWLIGSAALNVVLTLGIIFGLLSFSMVLAEQQSSYAALESEGKALYAAYSDLYADYAALCEEYNALYDEYSSIEYWKEEGLNYAAQAYFLDNCIALIASENPFYYHTYNCVYFRDCGNNYFAYNIALAEDYGYRPCSVCH